uniref:Secreted protein n=1 Tax=Anguilla anguilla TaxID=7936 RepID=A0A0E9PE60_ANGAN
MKNKTRILFFFLSIILKPPSVHVNLTPVFLDTNARKPTHWLFQFKTNFPSSPRDTLVYTARLSL